MYFQRTLYCNFANCWSDGGFSKSVVEVDVGTFLKTGTGELASRQSGQNKWCTTYVLNNWMQISTLQSTLCHSGCHARWGVFTVNHNMTTGEDRVAYNSHYHRFICRFNQLEFGRHSRSEMHSSGVVGTRFIRIINQFVCCLGISGKLFSNFIWIRNLLDCVCGRRIFIWRLAFLAWRCHCSGSGSSLIWNFDINITNGFHCENGILPASVELHHHACSLFYLGSTKAKSDAHEVVNKSCNIEYCCDKMPETVANMIVS